MKFTNTARTVYICLSLCGIASTAIARYQLNDSIAIITATDRPEQVIQHIDFSSLHFAKATDNRVNFGMAGNEYKYIVLKINAPTNREDLFLSIDNTSLDTVAVYRLENNLTGILVYRAGLLIPYDRQNKYVWHTVPVETKIFPSYYLIAMKAAEKNINVHYELLSSDKLQEKYFHHAQIVYFYMGVVSLIITTILLAFFVFRRKVLAAYLGYIVCTFIWILSHYGYLFPYMYPRLPMINGIIRPVSSIGACYFLLLVMSLVFAQQLQALQKILKFIRMMLYILPFTIISMLLFSITGLPYFIEDALLIIWHLALILSLCLIAITPINFIRSGATAKIFSTAMFVICTMTVVQLFDISGIINNYFIEEHGITLGSLLENIILAFGLFYNLLQERKQHEEQVLALEMEQAETLKKLITVQDNERKRIAGDLHDNIGPLLAALKINFNRIINSKKGANGLVQKTEDIIDNSILEIREIAHNLMPKGISSKGLINVLQDYFESMETLYHKPIIFTHQVQSIFLPDMQMNIYRIVCELVLNAAKHSNADMIKVSLTAGEKIIEVCIFDNGQGFLAAKQKNSIGLQSAESRVNYLKGKFSLQSEQGKGTAIHIEVPL